ncbi:MAG: hypothetical protein V3W41_13535 [Planctomycetota bacterium]
MHKCQTEQLHRALDHQDERIRVHALRNLNKRGELNTKILLQLLEDKAIQIQFESASIFKKIDEQQAQDQVRKITNGSNHRQQSSLTIGPQVDYDAYRIKLLSLLPTNDLEGAARLKATFDGHEYFALALKDFEHYRARLVADVSDDFGSYFEAFLSNFSNLISGTSAIDLVAKYRGMGRHLRERLTRRAVNVLCTEGDATEIDAIRSYLSKETSRANSHDANFLRQFGTWDDIRTLSGKKWEFTDGKYVRSAADFFYEVGRTRMANLLALDMPDPILAKLITKCTTEDFGTLPQSCVLSLLNSDSTDIRKSAALRAIASFSRPEVNMLLTTYMCQGNFRYYNVIHWLDLRLAIDSKNCDIVVKCATNELLQKIGGSDEEFITFE